MGKRQARILRRYIERSIALGLALLVPAVALLVSAGFTGGTTGVVLASIGSTLGTVALLSFLYDPFLKNILAEEIFSRVGLRDSVVRAGLREIGQGRDFRSDDLVGLSPTVTVLPLDPIEWSQHEFHLILGVATQRSLKAAIYLPSPDAGVGLEWLSGRLDISVPELERKLRSLPDELGRAWDEQQRHPDARLSIFYFRGAPSIGFFVCEACAFLEIGPAAAFSSTDKTTTALVYEPNAPTSDWLLAQLRRIQDDDATPAGLRPVTPPAELPRRVALSSTDSLEGSASVAEADAIPASAERATEAEDVEERRSDA
jgi:hypothetical protein